MQRIVVRGGSRERGLLYGTQARQMIVRCIDSYRAAFRHRAALDWSDALIQAKSYERAIDEFSPGCLQEMRGIAEGARVEFEAILALNCRSELMFAASRRDAGECTSFAVLPAASESGHMLLGQNWDWAPFALDTCVLLEAHRDDGPDYATVVEAGMLAKVGFNAAGLGVCTNTLVSTCDAGGRGVPYHVMLRALLDTQSLAEATRLMLGSHRALSANYLIAHKSGAAANFETASGDRSNVRMTLPEQGVLSHANHFLSPEFAQFDFYVTQNPHSLSRLDAMNRGLLQRRLSIGNLQEILRSHEGAPNGICGHVDEKLHPLTARATVTSVIADLTVGEVWISDGPPCSTQYQQYSLRRMFETLQS